MLDGEFPPDHLQPELSDRQKRREREKAFNNEKIAKHLPKLFDTWFPTREYVSEFVHPETGEQYTVVDVEAVKQKLEQRMTVGNIWVRYDAIADVLLKKFSDKTVLTTDQVVRSEFEPKPLFYIPDSAESAVDNTAIADVEFHLPLWELKPSGIMRERGAIMLTRDGGYISALEARVALTLFHPNYGDGRRNTKDGRLYVKNPNFKDGRSWPERVPLSTWVLSKYGLRTQLVVDASGKSRSIHEGLQTELPHLLENDTLKLEDFRELTAGSPEAEERDFKPRKIGKNGFVMVRGVNHYPGKEHAGHYVQPLGTDTGLIFDRSKDGRPKLLALFSIIQKDQAEKQYEKANGEVIPRADATQTNVQEIDYKTLAENIPLQTNNAELQVRTAESLVADGFEVLKGEVEQLEEYIRSEFDCTVVDCGTMIKIAEGRIFHDMKQHILLAAEGRGEDFVAAFNESIRTSKRLVNAIQSAVGTGDIQTVEDFRSFRNETFSGLEVLENQTLVKNLSDIYRNNYEQTDRYDEDAIESLIKGFKVSLENPNTRVYIRRLDKEVLAFGTRTDKNDNSSYLRALNNNPDIKGTGMGGGIFNEMTSDTLEEGRVATAEATPENFLFYSQRDWIATKSEPDELRAERFILKIERRRDQLYASKQLNSNEIIKRAHSSEMVGEDGIVVWKTQNPNEQPPLTDSDDHFVLTRYIEQSNDGDESVSYIYVLEPNQNTATGTQKQIAA